MSQTLGRMLQQERQLGKARMIARMYETGWSNPDVQQATGMTRQGIHILLKVQGVEVDIKTRVNPSTRVRLEPVDAYAIWVEKWKARILECKSDGCWIWNGGSHVPNPKAPSYRIGRVGANFTRWGYNVKFGSAHRLSYFLFKGEIGPYMTVDHTCHNSLCVNPDHLEAKTLAANSSNHSPEWHKNVRSAKRKKAAA